MTTHARIDLTNGASVTIDRLPKAKELAGKGLVSVTDTSGTTVLVNRRQIVTVTPIEVDEATEPRAAPQPWDA